MDWSVLKAKMWYPVYFNVSHSSQNSFGNIQNADMHKCAKMLNVSALYKALELYLNYIFELYKPLTFFFDMGFSTIVLMPTYSVFPPLVKLYPTRCSSRIPLNLS